MAPAQADFRSVVQGLADRLCGEGMPLIRLNVGVDLLHPEMLSANYVWKRGDRFVHRTEVPHGIERTDIYTGSPYKPIHEGTVSIRRRLVGPDARIDFPVLEDILAEGGTDYLVVGLPRSDGGVNRCSFAVDRPEGFTGDEIARLVSLRIEIGLIAELFSRIRMTRGLLDLYLGSEAGPLVFNGRIKRGEGATIRSVLWIGDLRGFTRLSETLPLERLTDLLNRYFEAMVGPVHAHDGEVLKLMGDGVLAIFRIPDTADIRQVCEDALNAAELAAANMGLINRRRARDGEAPLGFGIALHVGDVMYGNVGTRDRLDFTVIGPAVNLCARLEALAGQIGEPIVCSEAFAVQSDAPLRSLGLHDLRNIERPVEAFVPESR